MKINKNIIQISLFTFLSLGLISYIFSNSSKLKDYGFAMDQIITVIEDNACGSYLAWPPYFQHITFGTKSNYFIFSLLDRALPPVLC